MSEPTGLLRAKRNFKGRLDSIMSSPPPEADKQLPDVVALANMGALLEILSGGDVATALTWYQLLPGLDASRGDHVPRLQESIAIASSRLLFYHVKTLHAQVPPALLRDHTRSVIDCFPDNSILLGTWLESERGETVWGRVRQALSQKILKATTEGLSPTTACWGVWHETRDVSHWEVERARALLKRTLDGDR